MALLTIWTVLKFFPLVDPSRLDEFSPIAVRLWFPLLDLATYVYMNTALFVWGVLIIRFVDTCLRMHSLLHTSTAEGLWVHDEQNTRNSLEAQWNEPSDRVVYETVERELRFEAE
jgi:hypothetical protein